ncbi:MAG: DUF4209 domain-containing protein [Hyphomicrobium sp.]
MSSGFVVPAALDAVIRSFDADPQYLNHHAVFQALQTASPDPAAWSDAERAGAYAETVPFALMPSRGDTSPWGTYFGPMASWESKDGAKAYSPDISGVDAHILAYWSDRARNLTHPTLKARYADAAWDMTTCVSGARRDPEMARIAADAYLATASFSSPPNLHRRIKSAVRSLQLAALIGDQPRIGAARNALLGLHREAVDQCSRWWLTFDSLIDNKRAGLSDVERQGLVQSLEDLLVIVSDSNGPKKFNPHDAESIVKRLSAHYRKIGKPGDVRRLHTVLAKAFEHFASLADNMLASVVLQMAVNAYRDAGLPDDSKRMRILMEQKIGATADEMVPITAEIEVKGEDMEKFLASVVVDNPLHTLVHLAAEFLTSRPGIEKLIDEVAKTAPLHAHLTHTIMAADHVAAKVGSVDEDANGRVINQAAMSFGLNSPWLDRALVTAVERHALTPRDFVAWINRLGLFDDVSFLLEGVAAWYHGDITKALHVLVPQVEAGLRNVVEKLGKPVTKPHGTMQDRGVSINMGDILNNKEVADALGPDIVLHYLALYADPRGRNLRNDLAHGLLTYDEATGNTANWVIHSLLVFGIWNKLAHLRRSSPPAPDAP